MNSWLFVVLMFFSGEQPVFGKRVIVEVRTESQESCDRLRKVLIGELKYHNIQVGECRNSEIPPVKP